MSVVGFDFGNASCIVSVCRRGGLDVLQNEVGNRKTATMVAFSRNQRLIGDSAVAQAGSNWKNTIRAFKGLVAANRMDHPDLKREQKHFAYSVVDRGDGQVGIEVKYDYKKEVFAPQQITAAMMQQLRATAEKGLNSRVTDCVISVPPLWTQEARLAMLDAANIAGLNVLRLMNETTAVGLVYGILRQLPPNPINVLFVDMGESHTNASVAQFVPGPPGQVKILSVKSDHGLGGRDFDTIVFDYFAAMVEKKYRLKVRTNQKACLKLMKACQKVKLTLSANMTVPFAVEYLMNDTDVKGQITRSEFEAAAAPLVSRIVPLLESALSEAGLTKSDLYSVEIVGGGVRVPCVQRSIQEWYGGVLSKTCDGDESVAKGCALQCAMLSPAVKVRDFNVVDRQPFSVNLEWGSINSMEGLESLDAPLFVVGDSLPCVKNVSFSDRRGPFQVLASYADPSALPAGTNSHIGRWVIKGFPEEIIDEHPKIKVEFNLDIHGLFTCVKATLIQVKPEEPAPDSNAMDTEEGKDTEKKEAEKPKKKKLRTALTVEAFTLGCDQKTRQAFYERECAMNNQDRVIHETAVARDMLERYVLEMKSRVEDSEDLANYCTDAEKTHFFGLLDVEDDWLMSDEGYDANKSQYKSKLAGLMKFGSPLISRKYEHQERKGSVETVRKMVHHYQQFAQTTDEKYAHITIEQRLTITTKCNEVDQWIAAELTKQDLLALNVNPTLTKKMLIAKAKELDAVCKPIKNTPKPAPPAPEEKKEEKKEEKSEKTEESAATDQAEPMETTQ